MTVKHDPLPGAATFLSRRCR